MPGRIKLTSTRLIEALTAALEAIESNPKSAEAHKNFASRCRDCGHLNQALTSISQAILLDPSDPNSYWIQGSIFRELGNFREALQSNHQALKINPHNIDATIELGHLYRKLGNPDQALAYALKSIKANAADTNKAYDLLTLTLQQKRNTISSKIIHPIEIIDAELRKLKLPGADKSTIRADEIQQFIKKALIITASLDQQINTSLTQIYHVQQSEAPNCSALSKFFLAHQAIAKRCHNCYKIQLCVKSLDELLMLHFFMKTLHPKDGNISKCMIELRTGQNNFYKGLIYCSDIKEAEQVAENIILQCRKRTTLSPEISINRGCFSFRKKYPDYGAINTSTSLQEGPRQREPWSILENKLFKQKNSIAINRSASSFNLGEWLIIKNWIAFANAMGDPLTGYPHPSFNHANANFVAQVEIMKDKQASPYPPETSGIE